MFNDWTHLVPSIGLPLRRPLCVFLITHLIKTVFGQSYNLHVQGSVLFPTNGCWVETHELFSYIFLNFKSLIYERFYFIWKKKTSKVTFVIFVFILQTQILIQNSIRQQKIPVSGFQKYHLHDIPRSSLNNFYPNNIFC